MVGGRLELTLTRTGSEEVAKSYSAFESSREEICSVPTPLFPFLQPIISIDDFLP